MISKESKDIIHELIGKGEIEKSISQLLLILNNTSYKKDIISFSSRFNRIWKSKRQGIMTLDHVAVEENKIANDILEFMDDIKIYQTSSKNIEIASIYEKSEQKVQIIINESFNAFNVKKRKQVQTILAALLEIEEDQINILHVSSGSTKIIIEMPSSAATKLVNSFLIRNTIYASFDNNFELIDIRLMDDVEYKTTVLKEINKFLQKDNNIEERKSIKFGNLLNVINEDNCYVLILKNDSLTYKSAPELNEILSIFRKNEIKNIVLDFSKVNSINSYGLSVLLEGKKMWNKFGLLVIAGITHANVIKLFELGRFKTAFIVLPTINDSIEYIKLNENK